MRTASGEPLDYDVAAQTRATIENIKTVLEAAGSSLDAIVDITCFLIDMDRDFATFNAVYREYFEKNGPTRTTLEVRALPTPIASPTASRRTSVRPSAPTLATANSRNPARPASAASPVAPGAGVPP